LCCFGIIIKFLRFVVRTGLLAKGTAEN